MFAFITKQLVPVHVELNLNFQPSISWTKLPPLYLFDVPLKLTINKISNFFFEFSHKMIQVFLNKISFNFVWIKKKSVPDVYVEVYSLSVFVELRRWRSWLESSFCMRWVGNKYSNSSRDRRPTCKSLKPVVKTHLPNCRQQVPISRGPDMNIYSAFPAS